MAGPPRNELLVVSMRWSSSFKPHPGHSRLYNDETRASHKTHCCQYWVISPHHSLAIFLIFSRPCLTLAMTPTQTIHSFGYFKQCWHQLCRFHILINMPSFSFLQNCCPITRALASAFSSGKDDLAALLVNKYIGWQEGLSGDHLVSIIQRLNKTTNAEWAREFSLM